MFLAGFPLSAGKDARGDIDQPRSEFEYAGGVPRAAVAGPIFADIQGIRHTGERNVLDDHFGEEAERLHFERVIFQVTAIGADAQPKGNFLGSGRKLFWLRGRRGFHFALPLEGDKGPAGVVHLRKIGGSGEDGHPFTHTIDLFHGSLPDGDFQMRKTYFPTGSWGNFHAVGAGSRRHRIKKTSGKREGPVKPANVRWRDESVALPDTSRGERKRGQPGQEAAAFAGNDLRASIRTSSSASVL